MSTHVTIARFIAGIWTGLIQGWTRFWFESAPTTPLELARIGVGGALLINYGMATPHLRTFWGSGEWVPLASYSTTSTSGRIRCSSI